jgi:hypothetical protein
MSKLKHEIKASALHEMGVKLEDVLEAAKMELAKFRGVQESNKELMQKVEDLCAHVDNDLKAGVFDIATAGHVKKYILRAVEVIRNLGIQAEINSYTAQGRIQGTQKTIALTKAMFDAERASVVAMEAIEKAVAAGEEVRPHERVSGVHPGNPLADRVRKSAPLPSAIETQAPTESPPKPELSVETKPTDPVEEAVAMVAQAEVTTSSVAKVGSDDPFDMLDALAGSSSDSGPSSPELTVSTPKRTRRKGG